MTHQEFILNDERTELIFSYTQRNGEVSPAVSGVVMNIECDLWPVKMRYESDSLLR